MRLSDEGESKDEDGIVVGVRYIKKMFFYLNYILM